MTFPGVGSRSPGCGRPTRSAGCSWWSGLTISLAVFATEYAGRVAFTGASLPGADVVAWARRLDLVRRARDRAPACGDALSGRPAAGAPLATGGLAVAIGGRCVVLTGAGDPTGPARRLRRRLPEPIRRRRAARRRPSAFVPLGSLALCRRWPQRAVTSLVVRFRREPEPRAPADQVAAVPGGDLPRGTRPRLRSTSDTRRLVPGAARPQRGSRSGSVSGSCGTGCSTSTSSSVAR